MGLDQYLYLRKKAFTSKPNKDVMKALGADASEGKLFESLASYHKEAFSHKEEIRDGAADVCYEITATFEIGYWRKANEIHEYFLNAGKAPADSNCEFVNVSIDDIKKLWTICNDIVSHYNEHGMDKALQEKVKDVLPTRAGFFFGSTDYDEYYIEDLKQTMEICERVMAFWDKLEELDPDDSKNIKDSWDIAYYSWW